MEFQFYNEIAVRDYECDFQGIVNNAVYLNYLEHTRHQLAKDAGLDVVDLARRGVNVVVVRSEVDYVQSLRSGDVFIVGSDVERLSRLKFVFIQRIYRIPSKLATSENESIAAHNMSEICARPNLIIKARMTATSVNEKGRPFLPPELDVLFKEADLEPG
ncbi:MAG: acyl-CoA thioesterase [Candidatus Latescibacteria bacterium]|jgi:acyl-CoA thioester hydrolase|nr:acyl-CoA thioesterase [Candidatus Latescibacterota bacterium]